MRVIYCIILSGLLSSQVLANITHVPAEQATIGDALAIAENYDTIIVASGIYSGNGFQNLQLNDFRDLTIISSGGAENCIIDLDSADFLTVGDDISGSWDNGSIIVDGITFRKGNTVFNYKFGGFLTVKNSNLIENYQGANIKYPGYGGFINCLFLNNYYAIYSHGVAEFFQVIFSRFINNHTCIETSGLNNNYNDNIFYNNDIVCIVFNGAFENFYKNTFYDNTVVFWSWDTYSDIQGQCNDFYENNLFSFGIFEDSIETLYFKNNYFQNPFFCDTLLNDIGVYPNSILLPENNSCNTLIGNVFEGCYYCGDVNGSIDFPDIADLVYLVDFMFNDGNPPPMPESADVDGSGLIDIADLVYMVDYMFNGGPELSCPPM